MKVTPRSGEMNALSQVIHFQMLFEAAEEVDGRNFERVASFMRRKDVIFII